MTVIAGQNGGCEQLARFFPDLALARVPVRITALRHGAQRLQEATLVQYAADEIIIFPTALPLEFDDRVRIEKEGNSRAGEAIVVALQYHEGNKAVAVKLLQGRCDWITKP